MHLRVLAFGISLTILTLVPPPGDGTSPASANGPLEGTLRATLIPPRTFYRAEFPNPGTLKFRWEGEEEVDCGTFHPATPLPDQARWDHADEDGCPHDTFFHPGTITVVVVDSAAGQAVKCTYEGSLSGVGTCEALPPPLLFVNDVEEREGIRCCEFTISLSRPADDDVTGVVATVPGTACEGEAGASSVREERNDYRREEGEPFTIPAGEETTEVGLFGFDDLLDEPKETFFLLVVQATNATIADGEGMATIIDNDEPPSIVALDAAAREGQVVSMPVPLGPPAHPTPSGKKVSVQYETVNVLAKAGSDYVAKKGTLRWFPPLCGEKGEAEKFIDLTLKDDDDFEGREQFSVRFFNPSNASLERRRANVTILDND